MSAPNKSVRRSRSMVSNVARDGTIIEMLFRPDTGETAFAVYSQGHVSEEQQISEEGNTLWPYSPKNNLLAHRVILFPSRAATYESEQGLVETIQTFIHRFADLTPGFEELAAHYVLLTWVYDAFTELPYLRLQGDYGSGKSRCLLTIGALCYKPMFASGASTVSPLFRIIDTFRGTLILDESDFRFSDERADIVKILNNGNSIGFPVLRSESTPSREFNPRAFNVFGPKIIATRSAFEDRALESRCITEFMAGLPLRAEIPLNLPAAFYDEAAEIRNQLLSYRFEHLHDQRDLAAFKNRMLEPRIAQLFAPLLSVAGSSTVRERFKKVAREKNHRVYAERGTSVEAHLLEVLSTMIGEGMPLGVKDVASRFADRFASEYERPITPRWIGAQLRNRLSLVPLKTNGSFVIPRAQYNSILAVCSRYGLELDGDMGTSETLEQGT